MIENFFLQTTLTSNDLSWVAILIAGISAVGIIGTLLLNWKVISKENDRKYAELVSKYIQEFNSFDNERTKLKGKSKIDILTHIAKELNKVEEIVFLNEKGKIPLDLTNYFKQYILEAYTMLEAIDGKDFEQTVIKKEHWNHLLKWCEKHKITQTDHEPIPLMSLFDLWKKSSN